MAQPTEQDPIDQLFAVYEQRTGESITARFFRLRDEDEVSSQSRPSLTDDAQDQAEEAFWAAATAHAARTWRGSDHE